jgi:glycosyltransferase involved in cell wall biosynthesis
VDRSEPAIVRTAFVSSYPPRRCGIATFTNELGRVTGDREVVVLHPPEEATPYPIEVHHRIRRDERLDYVEVAHRLAPCVDVVSIQHEYGLWGGEDGEAVIDFVRALPVPSVATLHTVLRDPTEHQRAILTELVARTSATVVMSQAAASVLVSRYDVDQARIEIIPHGVPDLPIVDSSIAKAGLELAGRPTILSFGLLGPGKGYELAIEALPAVVRAHPDVLYVIVGATHPDQVHSQGEAYRESLVARVARLKLGNNVRFVDRFVGRVELMRWLQSCDVFVTPYPNLDQIVSGTLSYAMGAGRAIVSTPYAYAAEVLADDRGVLVGPGSSAELAAALIGLLSDHERREAVGRNAHAYSRRMVWSSVGREHERVLDRAARASGAITAKRGRSIPRPIDRSIAASS